MSRIVQDTRSVTLNWSPGQAVGFSGRSKRVTNNKIFLKIARFFFLFVSIVHVGDRWKQKERNQENKNAPKSGEKGATTLTRTSMKSSWLSGSFSFSSSSSSSFSSSSSSSSSGSILTWSSSKSASKLDVWQHGSRRSFEIHGKNNHHESWSGKKNSSACTVNGSFFHYKLQKPIFHKSWIYRTMVIPPDHLFFAF